MPTITPDQISRLLSVYISHQLESGADFTANSLDFLSKLCDLNMAMYRRETAHLVQAAQHSISSLSSAELGTLATKQLPSRVQESFAFAQQKMALINKTNALLISSMQQHAIDMNKQFTACLGSNPSGTGADNQLAMFPSNGLPSVFGQMIENGKHMAESWNSHMARFMSPWGAASFSNIEEEQTPPPAKTVRAVRT
ncbi:hypothetical protein [Herbaspirillum sp. alder98]|uniref:hypothetical protein n=1 Tax=Herbaspirillum sp. alder98 TaxID=2913096 RepID=UPI001CD8F2D0|nr:hypothetical protein [Herbaspirillum sp. alder98]MCA1324768.1 hypothetical protein [Herbaspirillum sp. alder98]